MWRIAPRWHRPCVNAETCPTSKGDSALRVGTLHAWVRHVEWSGPILVVDDDLATREMLVDLLREERIDARSVSSVDEALEALRRADFEAVLSDIQMPGKDGFALLSEMRRLGSTVPVILMTSFGTDETAREAIAAGASDCLLKPFAREALLATVTRALESSVARIDSGTRS